MQLWRTITIGDLAVILLCAGGLAYGGWLSIAGSTPGGTVEVVLFPPHAQEQVLLSRSLEKPGQFTVNGLIGPATLEIQHHAIRFLRSPCPNHLCEHMPSLERGGQVLVCLPNRLLVRLQAPSAPCDAVTR